MYSFRFLKKEINANTLSVGLFTNARDELRIKEWIAHHFLLGFDKIIILDHKSQQPLKHVLKNFDPRLVVLDAFSFTGKVKPHFMNWAHRIASKLNLSHFIYLDADEFLVLQQDLTNVHDLVKLFSVPSLSLNWLMFGSNFLVEEDSKKMLIEMYTKSDATINHHVKSLVKTNCVSHNKNPHFYDLLPGCQHFTFDSQGKLCKQSEPYWKNNKIKDFSIAPAFIAHYITQCEATFKRRKIDLPADDTGIQRSLEDIKSIHKDHNEVDNLTLSSKYSEKIRKFLFNMAQG
jgi:hypothetical protein